MTGKEHTCYFARVLDEDLPLAADVITDMVTSATISPADVESERGVILEELAMNDDDPSDVVHERFSEAVLGAHPLGRPIGGTPASIADDRPRPCGVGTSGSTTPGRAWSSRPPARSTTTCSAGSSPTSCPATGSTLGPDADPTPRRPGGLAAIESRTQPVVVRRATEQANVLLGTTALTSTDERRYAMSVLNAVLGGGMSSRLFQEVREKRGLAYSVYSFAQGYSDAGYFGLYAGCAPAKLDQVLALMRAELERLAERRHHRGRAGARHRPAARRPGPRHGGHRLADVAAGQGRAGLRRVRRAGRGAAADR